MVHEKQRNRIPAERGHHVSRPPEDRGGELRTLFFESANELLQSLNEAGLELESRPADEEVIRRVRRAVHTLKGDSAACGFNKLSELAHELEDVLTPQIAQARGADLAELVLTAADSFGAMLNLLPTPQGTTLCGCPPCHDSELLEEPASPEETLPLVLQCPTCPPNLLGLNTNSS